MAIKSTVPVGYTERVRVTLGTQNIILSPPQFLGEGPALRDKLHSSCIVVYKQPVRAEIYITLLKQGVVKRDVSPLGDMHRVPNL